MLQWFPDAPGRIFVLATLLPLVVFALLLMGGLVRWLARPYRNENTLAALCYRLCGGERHIKTGAYLAVLGIGLAAVLSVAGLLQFLNAAQSSSAPAWAERIEWARIGSLKPEGDLRPALVLHVGYRIDHLTAILFTMVTLVSTCIFVFSLGYMRDETEPVVVDHEVPISGFGATGYGQASPSPRPSPPEAGGEGENSAEHHAILAPNGEDPHHLHRRGRYGRFFLYLSLFCFSMLNLLIADNLFQVFVSWELVGVCSYLLIGFYYERPKASSAATKAFIVNRVGDAGFLIGMAIVWTYFGTFDFQEIFAKLNSPPLPHYLFVIAGIGIFLGCVGKSAQFPLHTWLPDAMEGPTPVSALIHAATMVAAGVYLVGRVYPFFAPEVLLIIAYTGAITLFLAATIALVQPDIKRVLAYSTVSQLGYMMLGLGIGGWVAGLLHLLTHAFFKALLFLGSGSVIFGCHHEQDLRKMGGLFWKMPVTAVTMLVGVLAIIGTPFFSGWYSKDQILGQALGYGSVHSEHMILFILPLVTAGLTAFYMLRLWFLTFTGPPRDAHVHEHAHESPAVMTVPLLVLAVFSIGVAWGAPPWDAEKSYAGELLQKAEPASVSLGFAREHEAAEEHHIETTLLALLAAGLGVIGAALVYGLRKIDAERLRSAAPGAYRFLLNKWYFDELYQSLFVRPTVKLAFFIGRFDKQSPADDDEAADRRIQPRSVDGFLNALGLLLYSLGLRLRSWQTGLIRKYVFVLVLTVVVVFAILSILAIGMRTG
jgi:NADH-quinone oxidoreductase subunit L